MNDTERVMTIGQAAGASGLTRKAVRLYERHGLLTPIERSHADYRQFTDAPLTAPGVHPPSTKPRPPS